MHRSKDDKLKPIAIALFSLFLFVFIIYRYTEYNNESKEKNIRTNLYDLLITKKSQLEKSLNSRIYYTKGVAAYTSLHPDISESEFHQLADQLIKSDSVISTMSLSRDCIINAIFPYKGHESAIGLNLLDHPGRKKIVDETIKTGNTFIAGPVELVEGGIAFISYTPIFDQTKKAGNNFWGMTDIVIWKDKILNEINLKSEDTLYNYAIRGIDGSGYDGEVFLGDSKIFDKKPVTVDVLLPTGKWILAGMPKNGWNSFLNNIQVITISLYVSAFIISLLIWLLARALFKIRAGEKELKALFGAMDDLIIEFNRKGEYINIAPTNNSMLFKSKNELLGKSLCDVFDESTASFFLNAINKCFESKLTQSIDYKLEIDNEVRWFNARISFLNNNAVLYVAHDNTLNKNAEEKLKESELMLRELNKSKDKLFSIIAHDLRSPFNSTMGLIEILQKDFSGYSDEEVSGLLTQIDNSLKGQFNILENLLNWAQIQTNRIEIKKESINIYDFIENELITLRVAANKKNINIKNEVDTDISIEADKILLRSVIHNLVGNAVKFTNPEGSVNIKSGIETNAVRLEIKDNGIGIDEQNLNSLFKEEFNSSTKGTDGEKGTGLGLLIVKEMVEKLGGNINVKSKAGEGSCFIITIPKS
ncbi:MAG: CHASE domain-containing protein [Melioribacteraceae bacterium]|nr:CHASE domain-containing protein [Melioribacteraceae bacterium]